MKNVKSDNCATHDVSTLRKSLFEELESFHKAQLSKSVKARLERNAKNGFHNGGIAPFGFQAVPYDGGKGHYPRKVLKVLEHEAEVIKLIFDLFTSQKNSNDSILAKVLNHLKINEIKRRGKLWTSPQLIDLIKDSTYYGERVFPRNKKQRSNDKQIIITVPSIVTKNTFILANKKLASLHKGHK
ncbi:recombinase family protein [Colwellia psychrerythraea]|uniref:Recombinase n=1 Tax=Colwellia psychrerythraea TaxID=28229 RepID=A0A099KIF2_COLPS|nr:recombinase family protein [Colwellia psychrerythraea]KGJ90116.1 Recombinase [Colwellia psychrerythraea]